MSVFLSISEFINTYFLLLWLVPVVAFGLWQMVILSAYFIEHGELDWAQCNSREFFTINDDNLLGCICRTLSLLIVLGLFEGSLILLFKGSLPIIIMFSIVAFFTVWAIVVKIKRNERRTFKELQGTN